MRVGEHGNDDVKPKSFGWVDAEEAKCLIHSNMISRILQSLKSLYEWLTLMFRSQF